MLLSVSRTTPTIMISDVPPNDTEAFARPAKAIGIVATIISPITPINTI